MIVEPACREPPRHRRAVRQPAPRRGTGPAVACTAWATRCCSSPRSRPTWTAPRACTACSTRPRSASRRSPASTGSSAAGSTTSARSPTTCWPTRALALFTIGETPWTDAQRALILDRLRRGDLAVVAIHSATDSCYGWDDYGTDRGRSLRRPPVDGDGGPRGDRPHTSRTAHLGPTWHWHDEVYQFRDLRADAQVLLRVPTVSSHSTCPARNPSFGFPLSWCFSEGEGRMFSTSLGHFPGAWESPAYLQHLSGGLAWAFHAD